MVREAHRAAAGLGDLAACADAAWLLERVPPPRDAAARARLAVVEEELAEVKAMNAAGRWTEGLAAAVPLEERASASGHPPLAGEALFVLGDLEERTGDYEGAEEALYRALERAEEGRDDRLKTEIRRKLAYTVGYRQGRWPEAHRHLRLAHAALRRLGGAPTLEALLYSTEGGLHGTVGRTAEARRLLERALAILEEVEPDSPRLVGLLGNLGGMYQLGGEPRRAAALLERGLALAEAALGPDHPDTASLRFNLALALSDLGRRSEAVEQMTAVLRARTPLLGADHADVAQAEAAVGALWVELDRPERGLPHLDRALPILEASFSPGHPVAAAARLNLADALRKLGRLDEALDHYRRAERAFAAGLGADSVYVALPLQGIAEVELARGRPAAARDVLETALALRLAGDAQPHWVAETRFALARALWDGGLDRPRARALAREALEVLAGKEGAPETDLRGTIEAWLAERDAGG